MPGDAFIAVVGAGDAGAALVEQRIDGLFFTGSLLIAFDSQYRLADFYFPRVGMENHAAARFRFGVWADGALRWRFRTGGLVISSPAVGDGIIYVGSTDHRVYALAA